MIVSSFGAWAETPFLAIVMIAFLACGASMVQYTSRIVYSMAREGNMPMTFSRVTASKIPRNAVICVVLLAGLGLLFGLNDGAVATVIAFGTGGLYAMFAMTTGVGLYTRLTGRWNPALGELKLGVWGLADQCGGLLSGRCLNSSTSPGLAPMRCRPMRPGGSFGQCPWCWAVFWVSPRCIFCSAKTVRPDWKTWR